MNWYSQVSSINLDPQYYTAPSSRILSYRITLQCYPPLLSLTYLPLLCPTVIPQYYHKLLPYYPLPLSNSIMPLYYPTLLSHIVIPHYYTKTIIPLPCSTLLSHSTLALLSSSRCPCNIVPGEAERQMNHRKTKLKLFLWQRKSKNEFQI